MFSLMAHVVDPLFIQVLASWMPSFVKRLLMSFVHLYWVVCTFLY